MVNLRTERDNALLQKLSDFGVLSTSQIRKLFFKDIRTTTMLRRLRILEERELIGRMHGLSDGSHGWRLTPESARLLGVDGITRHISRHTLEHDVVLSEVRLALESVGLGGRWTPEHVLRHKAWRDRTAYSKSPENIPDGIFVVERKGKCLPVAVELELSAKNRARYKKLFQAYEWNKSLFMLWYFVPNESFGKRLTAKWVASTSKTNHSFLMWSLIRQVIDTPYDIVLHGSGDSVLLRNILPMIKPAQRGALAMSRPLAELNAPPSGAMDTKIKENSESSSSIGGSPSAADPSLSTMLR